jgi:hypothetical protein
MHNKILFKLEDFKDFFQYKHVKMVFPRGTWILQTWICTKYGIFCVNFSFSGFVVLKKIFKWPHPNWEIVALRKMFVDRQESYDSFSAKSCVFLAHSLGYHFSISIHNLTQSKLSKNFQDIYQLLSYHQIWHPFATWPNIEISNMANDKQKFKYGTFKAALVEVRYLQG